MKVEALKELAKVFEKYNVEIWGCGCCGSPDLTIHGESVHDSERLTSTTLESLIKTLKKQQRKPKKPKPYS